MTLFGGGWGLVLRGNLEAGRGKRVTTGDQGQPVPLVSVRVLFLADPRAPLGSSSGHSASFKG